MASDDEIERLSNDLQSDEGITRAYAAEVLGNIGDPKAVGPLIERLEDEDSGVSSHAAKSLGDIRDKRAIDPLIEKLKDDNDEMRANAAVALGWVGDPKAVEPLIDRLGDKEYEVRHNAAQALVRIAKKGIYINLKKIQEKIGELEDKKETKNLWIKITNGIIKGKSKLQGKLSDGEPVPPSGGRKLVRVQRVGVI